MIVLCVPELGWDHPTSQISQSGNPASTWNPNERPFTSPSSSTICSFFTIGLDITIDLCFRQAWIGHYGFQHFPGDPKACCHLTLTRLAQICKEQHQTMLSYRGRKVVPVAHSRKKTEPSYVQEGKTDPTWPGTDPAWDEPWWAKDLFQSHFSPLHLSLIVSYCIPYILVVSSGPILLALSSDAISSSWCKLLQSMSCFNWRCLQLEGKTSVNQMGHTNVIWGGSKSGSRTVWIIITVVRLQCENVKSGSLFCQGLNIKIHSSRPSMIQNWLLPIRIPNWTHYCKQCRNSAC